MLIKQTNKKTMMSQNRFMGERKSAGKKVNKIKLSLIKNYTSRNEGSSATLKQTKKQKNLHSCKADSRWDLKKKKKTQKNQNMVQSEKKSCRAQESSDPIRGPLGEKERLPGRHRSCDFIPGASQCLCDVGQASCVKCSAQKVCAQCQVLKAQFNILCVQTLKVHFSTWNVFQIPTKRKETWYWHI